MESGLVDVHYVNGGTVVHDVFTRTVTGTKRPPHVTREEWDSAKKNRLKQWGWQKDWNELHPDRAVVEVHIPDDDRIIRKTGELADGPAPAGGAPVFSGDAKALLASVVDEPLMFPRMPRLNKQQAHRTKIHPDTPLFSAAVARPVGKKERVSDPRAQASVDQEWSKLRAVGNKGCWDESRVCSKL